MTLPYSPELDKKARPRHGLATDEWAAFWAGWIIWGALAKVSFRTRTTNLEGLPKDGAFLLLSNHQSMLDPFWAGWALARPLRFMTSAQVLRVPVLGSMLTKLGCFPKMKYVKDRASMETLAAHYANGQAIMLFPEGFRSWDGRQSTIKPGIGRLIKRLDARVVYARLPSAYLVQPRWAVYPRWIPVDVEYSGPHTFAPTLTVAEITERVRAALEVEVKRDQTRPAFGFRLAWGLPVYLWACPACQTIGGLQVDAHRGDRVHCTGCKGAWRVDLDAQLNGESDQPNYAVHEAFTAATAPLGNPPVPRSSTFDTNRELLVAEDSTVVHLISRKERSTMGQGRLRLTDTAIELQNGGETVWRLGLDELTAVSVEFQNRLQVRKEGSLYDITPGTQSTLCWGWFISLWRNHVQGVDEPW